MLALPLAAEEITAQDLKTLPPADVVFLGELHDNPFHHENQTAAVTSLNPAALVFEMLTPEQAGTVNSMKNADTATLAEALNWADTGWPDFVMYHPILVATEAPVFGAALPRGKVREAVGVGAAGVFGEEAGRFGLTTPLPDDQRKLREAEQMKAHCNALPAELLPGMVEAQRLRDAAIASAIVTAFEASGGPVVVITGNGHARSDWGVPHNLRLAAPDLSVLVIAQLEQALTPRCLSLPCPAPRVGPRPGRRPRCWQESVSY